MKLAKNVNRIDNDGQVMHELWVLNMLDHY